MGYKRDRDDKFISASGDAFDPDILLKSLRTFSIRKETPGEQDYIICSTEQDFYNQVGMLYPNDDAQDAWPHIFKFIKERFGAVMFSLEEDKLNFIPDNLDRGVVSQLVTDEYMEKIINVGIKRLLKGVPGKTSRTAAYQFNAINPTSRFEPAEIIELGLMNMHIKAGYNTSPLLIEMLGSTGDWSTEMLDNIARAVISLVPFDQDKALPLPLWYAKHALKPISSGNVLDYYKSQSREMLKNEELDQIWKADFDIFEE